jgi:hypothetical protein
MNAALVSCDVAAFAASVRPVTIRQWSRRYQITTACDLHTHRLVYDLADVMRTEAATRGKGRPRAMLDTAA